MNVIYTVVFYIGILILILITGSNKKELPSNHFVVLVRVSIAQF